MKTISPSAVAFTALIVAIVALVVAWNGKNASDRGSSPSPTASYEVAPAMGNMQRFTEKLYFAGQASNWELANFYVHEIGETMEEIIKANVIDEGVPVSSFMKSMLPPAVESMEEAVRARGTQQFMTRYNGLVSSCNACHQSTKHGFVRIVIPKQPTYENQSFAP